MLDTMQVIEELSGVHEAIRHYVMELNNNIASLESLASQCADEWSSGQCNMISDRQFDLKQNIQYIEKGLHDHYIKENQLLKPFIGDLLMKAVNKECREINNHFDQAKSLLSDISQGLPAAKDLTAKITRARQTVETFNRLVKEHSMRMDSLLQMLKSVI